MSETVRVEFDPPRAYTETEKAWILLSDEANPEKTLPKSHARPGMDGGKIIWIDVSRWLAEREGLSSSSSTFQEKEEHDTMSRYDWFELGLVMAFVIRGSEPRNALWEARNMARKLENGSYFDD